LLANTELSWRPLERYRTCSHSDSYMVIVLFFLCSTSSDSTTSACYKTSIQFISDPNAKCNNNQWIAVASWIVADLKWFLRPQFHSLIRKNWETLFYWIICTAWRKVRMIYINGKWKQICCKNCIYFRQMSKWNMYIIIVMMVIINVVKKKTMYKRYLRGTSLFKCGVEEKTVSLR
jgi:hypothetical protein